MFDVREQSCGANLVCRWGDWTCWLLRCHIRIKDVIKTKLEAVQQAYGRNVQCNPGAIQHSLCAVQCNVIK